MFIYVCLFTIIFFIILLVNNKSSTYKKIAIWCIGIIIIAVVGLRNIDIGIFDTANIYIPQFRKIQEMTLETVVLKYKDPVFYSLSKIFSLITINENIWLTLCAAIYILPIIKLICEESKYPLLSIIMFLSLNYFGMAFYGIRHCIALGITTLAYYSLKEKRFLKFIIIICLASMFHISSLVMLISYPIVHYYRINSKTSFYKSCILILIIFVIGSFFGKTIINIILNFVINNFGLTRFSIYTQENFSALNNNIFYINYFMYCFSGYIITNSIDLKTMEKEKMLAILKMQLIGTMISSFMGTLGECYRLSMFFSIYSIILLPEAIKSMKEQKRKIFFWEFCFIFVVYFFVSSAENNNIMPYKFFWE